MVYFGKLVDFVHDRIDLGDGGTVQRSFVDRQPL